MASVTITIPDVHLPRVVHALCVAEGLAETQANAKAALINHIKRTVKRVETIEKEIDVLEDVVPPNVDDIAT